MDYFVLINHENIQTEYTDFCCRNSTSTKNAQGEYIILKGTELFADSRSKSQIDKIINTIHYIVFSILFLQGKSS